MHYVILGTAGHIDHGKSSLVKALTGIDPDRLKEEKERGITIDLGFADLSYPDGIKVGIVDVPGHEKLIKNMLAGAGGIDIVLMVIAADEGIMPQSREHLAICNMLKVKKGLIALTKSDLVEKDWLNLVAGEIKNFVKGSFLEGAEIIPVSAKTGDNIDLLKEKIREAAENVAAKPANGLFRLPIDRVFTLKGFGTVVTGTAVSGSISADAAVETLPKGIKTKVRGLQSHGEMLKTIYAGQRAAVNLQGVSKEEIRRGDVLTLPDMIKPVSVIDAGLEILGEAPTVKSRSLVHVHTGTSEITARVIIYDKEKLNPGDKAYCQFRLQSPAVVLAGDRYIIRQFSPLLTIGGGEVLDPSPKRRKRKEGIEDLSILMCGTLEEKLLSKILQSGINGTDPLSLHGWIKAEIPEIKNALNLLVKKGEAVNSGGRLFHKSSCEGFTKKVLFAVSDFHKKNPLKAGMPKENLKTLFKGLDQKTIDELMTLIKDLAVEKEILRLKTFNISLSDDKKFLKDKILRALESSAFQPPMKDELARAVAAGEKEVNELLKIMAAEKSLVRINDSLYIPLSSYEKMIASLRDFFKKKQEMTVAEFRDILGTTRKYALPFLEFLDSGRVTLRVGDVRKFILKS